MDLHSALNSMANLSNSLDAWGLPLRIVRLTLLAALFWHWEAVAMRIVRRYRVGPKALEALMTLRPHLIVFVLFVELVSALSAL